MDNFKKWAKLIAIILFAVSGWVCTIMGVNVAPATSVTEVITTVKGAVDDFKAADAEKPQTENK